MAGVGVAAGVAAGVAVGVVTGVAGVAGGGVLPAITRISYAQC